MNSSKTANLLMTAHNYKTQGKKVFLLKPKLDDRFGMWNIASRALNTSYQADILLEPSDKDIIENIKNIDDIFCVLVDECQFLSEQNIEALRNLTNTVPVICYGLRTDYKSYLFEGSKRLMELADSIEEIKTICVECDRKAVMNAKFFIDSVGKKHIVKSGSSEPDLGAEEKYQPMCWKCWNK
jgi:thymidine kinase